MIDEMVFQVLARLSETVPQTDNTFKSRVKAYFPR